MRSGPRSVAVLGGSGFVGSAVMRALAHQPYLDRVRAVEAPRCRAASTSADGVVAEARAAETVAALVDQLRGVGVVVNAAGDPDASSTDTPGLIGANALMPVIALLAAEGAGATRFVHVSSAVVQGRVAVLDESSWWDPFSPYAAAKGLGEQAMLAAGVNVDVVIYRPPSVHAPDRRVTRRIAAIASSPWRSVAGRGDRPSPQALIDNVAAAVAHLCVATAPPAIVMHPWEGVTTGALLEMLGGRRPHHLPAAVAQGVLGIARATIGRLPRFAADLRRVELLWFGQRQADSWLTLQGWQPPVGVEGWRDLAARARGDTVGASY